MIYSFCFSHVGVDEFSQRLNKPHVGRDNPRYHGGGDADHYGVFCGRAINISHWPRLMGRVTSSANGQYR